MAVTWTKDHFIIDYRPDGRYGRRVRLHLPPEITDRAEAEAIEKDIKGLSRAEKFQQTSYRSARVDDLFPEYLSWYKLRRSSRTWRDVTLTYDAHLSRLLGDKRIEGLANEHLSLYQKLRKAEQTRSKVKVKTREKVPRQAPSGRTVNKEIDYFRGFLKWCRTEKDMDVPILKISKLPEARPIPMVLSPDEIVRMLEAADPMHRALILCLYGLGLRMNEARNIRRQDIDPDNRTLTVKQKGGSFKLLPLTPALLSALLEIVQPRPTSQAEDYIFLSRRSGKPVYDIRAALRRICKDARITKRVTPHLFRHSCATHLMSSGISSRIVQKFLGHKAITTTEFYTHVAGKHLEQAADVLGKLTGGK
jgi:integrase/recombinase XerC